MADLKKWWAAHGPSRRRLIQLYCALLYNAYLKGFFRGKIYTGRTKAVCVPGLNCYSCPGAAFACPLGALQNAAASSGRRAGSYVLGILLLYGLLLGRTVCGFLCPFGMIQELLYKIPTFKIRKSRVTRVLSLLKYVILAVFVLALPLWYGLRCGLALPAFCKYICPAGTLEGAGGLLAHPAGSVLFAMLGRLFTSKFVIMVLTATACIFCFRAFCRFLCPLGAIYGLFARTALTGVKVDPGKCTGCGACVRRCKMDVRKVGDRECIQCGECAGGCHAGAISLKAGEIVLSGPGGEERRGKRAGIFMGAALVLLLAVLVFCNI